MDDNNAPQLTPTEAARMCGVTIRTLHRWEEAGRITSTRTPGGHRRYRYDELAALLKASA